MSLHATMPLNFQFNSKQALESLRASLMGESFTIGSRPNSLNRMGAAQGRILGGNLSIIYSLLGTPDAYNFKGAILFLEDLSEQLYHVDRMFFALQKAGVFNEITALVVGGMTDLKDTSTSFGMTCEEIVLEKVKDSNIPICFNFPVGHIEDNRAMIIGANALIEVGPQGANLCYI